MSREEIVIVRTGEIALKTGGPRIDFEQTLFSNIMNFLSNKGLPGKIEKTRNGRIVVRVPEGRAEEACIVISRVFGVSSVSPATELRFSSFEALLENCLAGVGKLGRTFAVRAKRAGELPFNSQDFAVEFGARLLGKFPDARVDLTNPETEVSVDIRADGTAYLYFGKIPGAGGLPYGIEGKVLALLDGSEESVLAGMEAAKRGCSLEFCSASGNGEASARQVGRCLEFLPRKKMRVRTSGSPPEEIARELGCFAIVTGRRGDAPSREFSGILEICPLQFLSEEEILGLKGKYFSEEGRVSVSSFNGFFEVSREK